MAVEGIGYVEPASEVRKLTPRAAGVIRRCYVKAGDKVRKGAVLMELDLATQQAEVHVARRNLALAQADEAFTKSGINPLQIKVVERTVERLQEKLRLSRAEADRAKRMIATRAISSQEHESLFSQWRQTELELIEKKAELAHLQNHVTPEQRALAEARVHHARASLDLAEERAREGIVLAPCDGVILKVLKREGEGIKALEAEPVLLFGDLSRLKVRAEIDERFVTDLAVGQNASIYGRNLAGNTYRGKVVNVERIMGAKTVFARLPSERKDLDILEVLIETEEQFHAPAGLRVDVRIGCPPR
jgi:HlyD family secretion protein